MMKRLLNLLLVLPLLAAPLAIRSWAASTPKSSAAQKAGMPSPTDAQLEATIRAKLAKSKIGQDGFKFHVAKGVVTREGTTGVMQHKGSATRMARSAGAVQVVNNIQVTGAGQKGFGSAKKAFVKP